MAETIILHETGGYYYDKMHHPEFISFAIKQLVLILQTQPSFITPELEKPLNNLCMHLNAYDVKEYGQSTYRLFRNLSEKISLLEYFEKATKTMSQKKSLLNKRCLPVISLYFQHQALWSLHNSHEPFPL